MGDPHISFPGGTFTVSGYAPSWALGNLGTVRLGDYFQITPPTNFSDIQVKAGLHVLDLTWGRKGSLWLEQSLSAGATYSLNNGVGGSLMLTNQLFWYPVKELHFTFAFTLSGKIDNTGVTGTMNFGSNFSIVDTKQGLLSAGLSF